MYTRSPIVQKLIELAKCEHYLTGDLVCVTSKKGYSAADNNGLSEKQWIYYLYFVLFWHMYWHEIIEPWQNLQFFSQRKLTLCRQCVKNAVLCTDIVYEIMQYPPELIKANFQDHMIQLLW